MLTFREHVCVFGDDGWEAHGGRRTFGITPEASVIRNNPRNLTDSAALSSKLSEMKRVPDTFLRPVVDYVTGYLNLPWLCKLRLNHD